MKAHNIRTFLPVLMITAAMLFPAGCGKEPEHDGKKLSKWIEDLYWQDQGVRYDALDAFGKMGPDAKRAVPDIIDLMTLTRDWRMKEKAADTLTKIGQGAVGHLIKLLEKGDDIGRSLAARILGDIGKDAAEAVPALTKALQDKDKEVRSAAAKAFAGIGEPAQTDKVLLALAAALKDPDYGVRFYSSETLLKFSPKIGPAIPALAEAMKDKDARVRGQASAALVKAGMQATPVAVAMLKDKEGQEMAANVLAQIGAKTVPNLLEPLKTGDANARLLVMAILCKFGADAAPAVPVLTDILKDKQADMRTAAMVALGSIGPAASPAVPALIEIVKGEDQESASAAGATLGSIGVASAAPVAKLFKEGNEKICTRAENILEAIGRPAVPALQELQNDPDKAVQDRARTVVQRITRMR